MYPTQVSEQPTQKLSEFFSVNLDIGAENTPKNSSFTKRKDVKEFFEYRFYV
jgi:hypothetical protein